MVNGKIKVVVVGMILILVSVGSTYMVRLFDWALESLFSNFSTAYQYIIAIAAIILFILILGIIAGGIAIIKKL